MTWQVSHLTPRANLRRETVALLCIAVIAAAAAVRFDLFETMMTIVADYEHWELDEAFSVIIVSGLAAIVISVRRGKALAAEIVRREASEVRAVALARHDPLTNLPNRRALSEQFVSARRKAAEAGQQLAILLIDLDRFKPVNDVHGHCAGDLVLTEIAGRLQRLAHATAGSLLARLGGDEFAFMFPCDAEGDTPERVAEQIIHSASDPIDIGAGRVAVAASIGIATCRSGNCDMDELLRKADVAMYRAKRDGRATFRSFEGEMDAQLRLHSQLETELRNAIPAGEIVPFYQPIMSLPGHDVVGFESLARWIHPVRGLLLPDTFIPVAEDSGLIDTMTFALLRRACLDARDWPANVSLSINVSPVQLTNEQLPEQLLEIMDEGGFRPERLIVEITESGIIANMEAARHIIAKLKSAGVKVALDDFGTGYSSLSHLRELQFDSVKIDRSFIKNMGAKRDSELVKAIIGMGHSLGMRVTAEGVESQGSLSALATLNCNHVQGYLFGRPASAADSVKLFATPFQASDRLRIAA